jgi:RNA polymerase sigma-70 factor (ECF subfamily)
MTDLRASDPTEFEAYRGLLFSIAYRMTGSAADAEDLVQDAYMRYVTAVEKQSAVDKQSAVGGRRSAVEEATTQPHSLSSSAVPLPTADCERDNVARTADSNIIRDVKAFLITILTRLALDRLKSAQHQRETYIGPWLPEPVLTGIDGDPYARAARDEKIEMALLRTLERLSPQERAVLLLHEVLDHDHNEIAELLEITPAASRQLLHRAKERVAAEKRRFAPPAEEQRRLIESFMAAAAAGNVEALRNVLTADVVAVGDGGGKAFAAKVPMVGFDIVSRFFFGLASKYTAGITISIDEVNGAPAVIARKDDVITSIVTFEYEGDRIANIASVVNPDKLQFAQRQLRSR